MLKKKIVFLVGPTASGKSSVSLELARLLNAEIISLDSMQIYKGMEIATQSPDSAAKKTIKHHLVNFVSPAKDYNVSWYRKNVLLKIKEILSRKKLPFFVGGTGLYMTVLLDGIFENPAEDKKVRERLNRELEHQGSTYLYKRLKVVDAQAAEKIHPNDGRRIIRALEVFEATGKPISFLQRQRHGLWQDYEVRLFCLDIPREILYERVNQRVEKMFKEGLELEIKKLLKKKNLSRTAGFAIGLRELKSYFAKGCSLEEAKEKIKQSTRNYAKRQLTWFRKDKRIEWVKLSGKENPRQVAAVINKKLKQPR